MNYYLIKNTLESCGPDDILSGTAPYAAVLTSEEWKAESERFGMGMDLDLDLSDCRETKAVVNYDSLTGSLFIPDRDNITGRRHTILFALDEKGVVLIDDGTYAGTLVEAVRRTKKWRMPSLERFLYDFLEKIIERDLSMLEEMETRLDRTERKILEVPPDDYPAELNEIRGMLLDLRVHYEQMIDLGQELEENENGFFSQENLRFFRLFTERVMRLQESVSSLREYVVQLRDLVQSRTEIRQNRIMTLLTVVTSVFMPLTLIAGWYGMNFRYMPELDEPLAYPILIVVSLLIVAGCLYWFRKKGWL